MERNSLFVWLEKEGKQDSEENWGSLLIVCFPGSEEGGNSSDVYESCVSVAKVFWNRFPFVYFLVLNTGHTFLNQGPSLERQVVE
jgi:hypothetical protein